MTCSEDVDSVWLFFFALNALSSSEVKLTVVDDCRAWPPQPVNKYKSINVYIKCP